MAVFTMFCNWITAQVPQLERWGTLGALPANSNSRGRCAQGTFTKIECAGCAGHEKRTRPTRIKIETHIVEQLEVVVVLPAAAEDADAGDDDARLVDGEADGVGRAVSGVPVGALTGAREAVGRPQQGAPRALQVRLHGRYRVMSVCRVVLSIICRIHPGKHFWTPK